MSFQRNIALDAKRMQLGGLLDLSNPMTVSKFKHEQRYDTISKPKRKLVKQKTKKNTAPVLVLFDGKFDEKAADQCPGSPASTEALDWKTWKAISNDDPLVLEGNGEASSDESQDSDVELVEQLLPPEPVLNIPEPVDTVDTAIEKFDGVDWSMTMDKSNRACVERFNPNDTRLNCYGRPYAHPADKVRCDVCGSIIRRSTTTLHRNTKKHKVAWALRQRDLELYETFRNCKNKKQIEEFVINGFQKP